MPLSIKKALAWFWPGISIGWSVVLMGQSWGFKPRSGHAPESPTECTNK